MDSETTAKAAESAPAQEKPAENTVPTKFCKHCGGKIAVNAVICPLCGCQVEEMHSNAQPQQIVINNTNTNSNVNQNIVGAAGRRMKNKWISLLLCVFLGYFGAHKFYEGRIGAGVLYLFRAGLFGIGWLIDCLILLFKPNPYFV